MTPTITRPAGKAPALIRLSNPLTRRLLRLGTPMGPNTLMTVRGRVSGVPRSAPVALIEPDGRRFIIGAYGDVQWVRNLRASGEADLTIHGKVEHMAATELDRVGAIAFFHDVIPAYVAGFPWFGRLFAKVFFRFIAPQIAAGPDRAAEAYPVFELRLLR
jgi:deazaflavin-dependent oxidoreductase (nitroreductase family)